MAGEPEAQESNEATDRPDAGFAVPRWARPPGQGGNRRRLRSPLGRKLLWLLPALLLVYAVWSSYPFIPNLWVALFRQPSGDATAESTAARWAMYGGNAQVSNFLTFADSPQGVIEHVIDVGPDVRSGAAVADGIVYIGGQSRVVAFDTATARQVWERRVSGPAHGVPAISATENTLYLGTLNKNVIALDMKTGQPKWEYEGDNPFPGSVTVHNGIVYAGSRGGEVIALDAESGKALWQVELGSPAVAPVAVEDGRLYAASSAGVLFARNDRTGDKRARMRTGAALVAPPVAADGKVYLISEGGLMAFDGSVREQPGRYPAELVWAQLWIWRFPLPAPPEHSGLVWRFSPDEEMGAFLHPPAVTREALYLGTDEGEVVALSPEDGSVLWRMAPASELRRVDGNLWWRMPDGGPVAAPLLAAGDMLIVAHEDGALRAINRYTQEELWELSLGSPVAAPLSFAAGKVFAHTQDGRLHIIK